ncbi:hypothetical protein ElyMa_005115300 [Elysia marginata]|uniref:Peptidase S1 domain-containing protein n=1 Tax=Elysia marginata TaxID=1093978 RepID=A0AAV4JK76_9GAST|nr:hypothetical protein ElyMa_005115300 [Elysia marginata]
MRSAGNVSIILCRVRCNTSRSRSTLIRIFQQAHVDLEQGPLEDQEKYFGHHECEVFSEEQQLATESENRWNNCEKNRGHENFFSVQYFRDNYLPKLQSDRDREVINTWIDCTVKLQVTCTSKDRPDNDPHAKDRGKIGCRYGTGFIKLVFSAVYDKPCLCAICKGKVAEKHWGFYVRTAGHVVFNTEEAKTTQVQLNYDDDSCEPKFGYGVDVVKFQPKRDWIDMWCVTCDQEIGAWIESIYCCWSDGDDQLKPPDLSALLPGCGEDCIPVLIASHPHGQPKKITLGEFRGRDRKNCRIEYSNPTCKGSSGAAVFVSDRRTRKFTHILWALPVHSRVIESRTAQKEHINCGHDGWLI